MALHLLEQFREYVHENVELGINGEDKDVPYIAPSKLKTYWSAKRVDAILNTCQPPIPQNSDMIISKYIQIFSILVYIGQPHEISWFCLNVKTLDDCHLPIYGESFPQGCSWADEFLTNQWKFHPLVFTHENIYQRKISCKLILPVTYGDELSEERGSRHAAKLWKVQVHTACNYVTPQDEPVVFKVYEGTHAHDLYEAETNVYLKLHAKGAKYITKHFACFSFQGKQKSIIVLEYAAGGSLLDFFRNAPQPVTPEDFSLLWGRLFKLLDALEVLHDLYRPEEPSRWFLASVHQDIQPANILVFPAKQKDSEFDVKFKLTDFGLAEIGRVSNSGGTMVTENRGNRMYISPESYANFSVQELVKTNVPPTADIWALGAVFSDVLVWSIHGEPGREKYRQRRRQKISNQSHMRASNYDACFHDGIDRLSAVKESHNLVLQDKRVRDSMSPYISNLILDFMLTEAGGRLTAMQIRTRAKKEMDKLQCNPASPSAPQQTNQNSLRGAPNPRISGRGPAMIPASTRPVLLPLVEPPPSPNMQPAHPEMIPNRTSIQQFPVNNGSPARAISPARSQSPDTKVTVGMVYPKLKTKARTGSIIGSFNPRAVKLPDVMNLPGMMEARSKIDETQGRDQIMVIDNFSSMKEHKQNVVKTARVVSYVAKVADNDGMELYAASEAARIPLKCKKSSQIETAIANMKTVSGTCDMQRCLNLILERVLVGNKVKPTSIYVYTDGIWEPGADHVRFTIQRAIDYLIKCGQPSSTLMFQFIQFGDNPQGRSRLQFLDDKCTRQHGDEEYDIVDTKHCNDHVPDIVIGSISKWHDRKHFREVLA
ncbi:kinase-like domain-containing protein [Fusarium venenatum]|uniref:kinase-like domain-containing protein n=1 Tax=Fusarium venenatum TaxID=56646 RepID=UPI001D59EB40|nr:kinase-like domain-containing protein [Fusarium venenatum]